MRTVLVATCTALLTAALAAPAAAEELTLPGCVSDGGVYPLTDVSACVAGPTTVTADTDPVEESTSCAYGPSIQVDGATVSAGGFHVDVSYTLLGGEGGAYYQPPFSPEVAAETETIDSGPLWVIHC